MKCNDCGIRRKVKLCQGDLMLCPECDKLRFGKESPRALSTTSNNMADCAPGEVSQQVAKPLMEAESSELAKVLNAILEMKDDIKRLADSQSDIVKAMDFINLQFETMRKRMENMQESHDTLMQDNDRLHKRVAILETELHSLDQYNRRINLEIAGVPESDGSENTDAITLDILQKIHPDITANDVDISHRIGTKQNPVQPAGNQHPQQRNLRSRPIIVRFTTRKARNAV
ncbi:uncharacterized protein LOC144446513 [Glandiceps talaboti]